MINNAVIIINQYLGEDTLSWTSNQDGCFTAKSAYELLCHVDTPRPCLKKLWESVWSVIAPERVRVFLWLTVKQVLMTNHERFRRHLAASELCQVCKCANETIIHVLRDCPAVEGIWTRLVPAQRRQAFFSQPLLEWIYENLNWSESVVNVTPWQTMLVMTLWWSWKWRCMDVFGSTERYRDRLGFVKRIAKEVSMAHQKRNLGNLDNVRVERLIAWAKPEQDWIKLNTDGAAKGNPGQAAAGGVVRDNEGRWRGGFALHIGVCSAPTAELWGVYYGLIIAWERGFRKVIVEIDSEIVVKFLQTGINNAHPLSFLVRMCHGFCSRDWIIRFTHVYREANRLADRLVRRLRCNKVYIFLIHYRYG